MHDLVFLALSPLRCTCQIIQKKTSGVSYQQQHQQINRGSFLTETVNPPDNLYKSKINSVNNSEDVNLEMKHDRMWTCGNVKGNKITFKGSLKVAVVDN